MSYELESMNRWTLENIASNIIWQSWHTKEDAKTLSQIKYFMALHSKKQWKDSAIQEAKYNDTRAKKSVLYWDTMAQWKAEAKAKSEAETECWNYREMTEETKGMNGVIKAIEWVIIWIQVELKEVNSVQV